MNNRGIGGWLSLALIVGSWYGYEESHKRALDALEKAGFKTDEK